MTNVDFINKLDEMLEEGKINPLEKFNLDTVYKVMKEYEKEEEERFYKNLRI